MICPPVLGCTVSLVAPPLQMLTVPLRICLLQISSSSSSGLYCDDMPCALYHVLFDMSRGRSSGENKRTVGRPKVNELIINKFNN